MGSLVWILIVLIFFFSITFILIGALEFRETTTKSGGSGGSLRLITQEAGGKYLLMFFDFEGGGGCRVAAVEESNFSEADLDSTSSYIVFVMDDAGKVTDFHQGRYVFCSNDMVDWEQMRDQVEELWKVRTS